MGQIAYALGIIRCKQGAERAVLSFGPVSVLPAYQKRGIGSALIVHAIGFARAMRYPAICIYGDPRYHSRFGFRCAERYDIKTADGKFAIDLQVLELKRDVLDNMPGTFIESPAFAIDETELPQYDAPFPFEEKKETESQREFRPLASLRY